MIGYSHNIENHGPGQKGNCLTQNIQILLSSRVQSYLISSGVPKSRAISAAPVSSPLLNYSHNPSNLLPSLLEVALTKLKRHLDCARYEKD